MQWFQVVHNVQNGKVHFSCLAQILMVLMEKQRMKDNFTAAGSHCCLNLKKENCLAHYVKKLHTIACHTCSMIIFPHWTNQIIDLWHCRGHCCGHFLTLPIIDKAQCKWTGRSAERMKDLLTCVHIAIKTLNLEISHCYSSWQTTSKNATNVSATHAAQ